MKLLKLEVTLALSDKADAETYVEVAKDIGNWDPNGDDVLAVEVATDQRHFGRSVVG
jgi:hypothetical protein